MKQENKHSTYFRVLVFVFKQLFREEEPQNIYINKTLVRQQKQSSQRSFPLQDDCKNRMDTK